MLNIQDRHSPLVRSLAGDKKFIEEEAAKYLHVIPPTDGEDEVFAYGGNWHSLACMH